MIGNRAKITAITAMAWRQPSDLTQRPKLMRGAERVGTLAASSRASSSVASIWPSTYGPSTWLLMP